MNMGLLQFRLILLESYPMWRGGKVKYFIFKFRTPTSTMYYLKGAFIKG